MPLEGVFAAAITPRGKQGEVDFGACFELIDFLCKAGVRGIALFTAAGEFAALAPDERSRLVYLAVKRSRVPVLVGVGSATLDASVALAREARDAGAEGLLAPPPYFFQYDQDDLREFYLRFAEQVGSGATTILSQPSRLEPATALELLSTGLFAGVEVVSDGEALSGLLAASRQSAWRLVAANDAFFGAAWQAGIAGFLSPAACAVPELMVALDRARCAGNAQEFARMEAALIEFNAWVDAFPHPVIWQTATALRGLKTGPLSLPLAPAKRKKLDQFREWFQGWLPAVKKLSVNG